MPYRLLIFDSIGTVGAIFQNISFTITVPLYLFIHLLTSPVAQSFPGTHANSVLLIDTWDLRILPLSVTLSYVIPSLLMILPAPMVSFSTHQKLIAFWQPFPIWTVCIHWALRKISQFVAGNLSTADLNKKKPTPLGASYLGSAKHVYRFILAMCLATHLPALLISLIPSTFIPERFGELAEFAKGSFSNSFIPYFPLSNQKVPDLAAGSLTFLQWDFYIGSTALLLWAVLLYRNATTEKAIVDPNTSLPIYRELLSGSKDRGGMLWRKLILKIGLWSLVSGPMGALTVLLWDRDTIVRQKIKQGL